MKILSCHIENFGKLSDCSFDFEHGLNRICEDNGYGKSTFAAFVRAMFYGLGGKGKHNDLDNERRRYKPWQGGVFGGQMIFSVDDKIYLMHRVFGSKDNGSEDSFELRDFHTNLISTDYSERIGEEIFGIDSESFSRTVFLGQNDCRTVATDDIHAKIGNLSEQTDDMSNFDKAFETLANLENKMNPKRTSGSLSKRAEEIREYEAKRNRGALIAETLERLEEQQKENQQKLLEHRQKMQELTSQQDELQQWTEALVEKERMEQVRSRKKDAEDAYQECVSFFPKEIPDEHSVERVLTLCQCWDSVKSGEQLTRLSQEEKDEYEKMEPVFRDGIPSEQELQTLQNQVKRLQSRRQEQLQLQMTEREKERLSLLTDLYENRLGESARLLGAWSKRDTLLAMEMPNQIALSSVEEKINSDKEEIRQTQRKKKTLMVTGGILLAVAFLLLMLCVILFSDQLIMWGLSAFILVAGGALLLMGILLTVPKENVSLQEKCRTLQENMEKDRQQAETVELEIQEYFANMGIPFEEGSVEMQLQELVEEEKEYRKLLQKQKDSVADSGISAEGEKIRAALQQYGLVYSEDGFMDGVILLMNKAGRFRSLQEKERRNQSYYKDYEELRKEYQHFVTRYGFHKGEQPLLQLEEIREQLRIYNRMKEEKNVWDARWMKYCEEHDTAYLGNLPGAEERARDGKMTYLSEIGTALAEQTEQCEDCKDRERELQDKIADVLEEQENYEEGLRKLEELRFLQEQEEKKYHAVQLAKEKLQLAKEAMTAKYAKPLLTSFCEYYGMLTGEVGEHFHMDANTQITVDELGKQRMPAQLSYGSRDLIDFCLRLAMVDAMYLQEKPALILDDPFVNLDDVKVEAAKELLEKVSEKYQIIYCTCSKSR